jgi:hypothetical protein
MSQSIAVTEYNEHKMIDERAQPKQSERTSWVGRISRQGSKGTDRLQDKSIDTLVIRTAEADGMQGVTKLGQVMMFLIELADKDTSDCKTIESCHGGYAR